MPIPVLGDQYGRVLSAGQTKVEHNSDRFQVRYMGNLFRVAPRSLSIVLQKAAECAYNDTLNFIADSFSRLSLPESADLEAAMARHRDKTVIYGLLKRLCEENPEVVAAIAQAANELNNDDCDAGWLSLERGDVIVSCNLGETEGLFPVPRAVAQFWALAEGRRYWMAQ